MIRRAIDVAVAAAALVLLSPLLALVAIAVAASSPGGPFYAAWRAGRDGRPFRLWKFRTMIRDADRQGPAITGPRDRRITWLGLWLRRAKLDELPQLYNLLRGDITLVGPRPEALSVVGHYTAAQRAVLALQPGITGPSQLEAGEEAERIPPGVDPEEYYLTHLLGPKILRDLEYARTRTAWTDAVCVARTAWRVIVAAAAPLLPSGVGRRRNVHKPAGAVSAD